MRLRSGFNLDRAEVSLAVESNMEEENYSTKAEKGTPSASFASNSDINDNRQQPDSPIPEKGSSSAENQTPQGEQQDRAREPLPDADLRSTPTPSSYQLRTPGTLTQPGLSHESASSSRIPIPRLQVPATLQTPPHTEAIERFRSGPRPWSPTAPTDAEDRRRKLSDDIPGIHEYPRDRSYPDKLQTDLNKLEKGEDDDKESEEEKRRTKRPRREKTMAEAPSKGRGKDRKDRDRRGSGQNSGRRVTGA